MPAPLESEPSKLLKDTLNGGLLHTSLEVSTVRLQSTITFFQLTKELEPQIAPVTVTGRTNMKQLVSTLITARTPSMPIKQLATWQIVSGCGSVVMSRLAPGKSKY